jgi:hypothetical protein
MLFQFCDASSSCKLESSSRHAHRCSVPCKSSSQADHGIGYIAHLVIIWHLVLETGRAHLPVINMLLLLDTVDE